MGTFTHPRLSTYDFLRGIAITGVVAVHTSQYFPSGIEAFDLFCGLGRFGVQLFFLVSALTMCHMWQLRSSESRPIQKFYIRRFFRIAPLFWLAIPTYLLINGVSKNYWAPEGIKLKEILLTATFTHGFWPSSITSVVPGGWSIAVEMTFYLIFPFLIILIKNRSNVYLILAFIIWAFYTFIGRDLIGDFLINHYQTNRPLIIKEYLYLNFLNQAPIFLIGCFLYFSNSSLKKIITLLLGWMAIGAGTKYLINIEGFNFLILYLSLSILVYYVIRFGLTCSSFQALGRNSYGIYLTHFSILTISSKHLNINHSFFSFSLALIFTIFISYLISRALHYSIEIKINSYTQRLTSKI
jgi:exopolysaccharide production protein ExoZ